ncbi:rhodanese signature 1 [Lucifera butyrica]|uniref:Rhodanese signature 1 n=1 Tax=Lucifera butyrica TaxID=1351585 RepID=A0A498RAM1_9FIRM|nr:tRNA 2-selenouridine(34) synthase MnmH [Lucifera butyrica]VBB08025.1 rhodanese signature 1 [Lucifera butyrica]
MLHKVIDFEHARVLNNPVYIDTRSPGEFAAGHIPGAVNIPLFTDEERAEVGTVYHKVSADDAKERGLAIVSTKLPELVKQVRHYTALGQPLIVYCWRGGLRSRSVVSILELMGIPSWQLRGGYKAYRRYVLESLQDFQINPEIVVLCGSTGVGKTGLLSLLSRQGIPVIDLEGLANHRGSIFGQIGLGMPASAKNFDAQLLNLLQSLNGQPFIVVECESKRIGNVYLPDVFYAAMQKGKKILVQADLPVRIQRLLAEYMGTGANTEAIFAAIQSLKKRLGEKKSRQLMASFTAGKLEEAVVILLTDYYDPLYGYEEVAGDYFDLKVNANDLVQAANQIIGYLKKDRRLNYANGG